MLDDNAVQGLNKPSRATRIGSSAASTGRRDVAATYSIGKRQGGARLVLIDLTRVVHSGGEESSLQPQCVPSTLMLRELARSIVASLALSQSANRPLPYALPCFRDVFNLISFTAVAGSCSNTSGIHRDGSNKTEQRSFNK